MPIDQAALTATIARLDRAFRVDRAFGADGSAHRGDGVDREPPAAMDPASFVDLVVGAADRVFALSGVGLMFLDADDALRYVAASDETIRALESAQEQLGEGPCLDSLVQRTTVRTHDLTVDERYRSVGAVVGPLGVRAVLGVPVDVAGVAVGTLNVYRDRPHEWDDSEVDAVHAFATVLGSAFTAMIWARRGDTLTVQLGRALESRIVVERAIGFLMGVRRVDAVTAFDTLRRAARRGRRTVADVAQGVLGGDVERVADPVPVPGVGR
ncbi:GAF and ANTAR domain-containing protein [Pseudonocardia sp.]|uniref:GAF and ANTAR domain-containing protein n=1 Tax=Pseudonocardia sp. TaxID=60912 RepID=UPI002607D1E9|nr:GAF and ANTAR domain-containing protein [Pseudonocardia sp.]